MYFPTFATKGKPISRMLFIYIYFNIYIFSFCCSTFAVLLKRAQGFARRAVLAQTAVPAKCNGKTEKARAVFAQTALPARCSRQEKKKLD